MNFIAEVLFQNIHFFVGKFKSSRAAYQMHAKWVVQKHKSTIILEPDLDMDAFF